MRKVLMGLALALLLAVLALAGFLYLRYGGGRAFPDASTAPLLPSGSLDLVATLDEPPGNIAVSADGRVFITIHPESKPQTNHVVELIDGAAVPFPSAEAQAALYRAPQGIRIDRQGRLWTIDHGDNGIAPARLVAVDIATREVVHNHVFDRTIAPQLSYLQDLNVSPDGATVYIADVSFFRQDPGLIVYNVASETARRVLDNHPAVESQGYRVRVGEGYMERLGGLIAMKPGLDTMALSVDGATLFIGPMSGGDLYRVSTADLANASLSPEDLAARVTRFSSKPLSDGASIDAAGNLYITDVENNGVARVSPQGELATLIRDQRVRWADGLSFGPGGWIYLADSAIPWIALRSRAEIDAAGPYHVWRFRAGGDAPAGQ